VKFAISLPQECSDGAFDPDAFATYARRAEELGFDSAWTQEQVLGPWPQLGALETMTFAAACTSRLRIGCSVFVSPLHQPVQLAKSLASLDQLSRGRLEIGFGTGGHGRPFSAFGIGPDHLVSRFTEGIEVMKACWTEPEATLDGRFWQLKGATMEPKPFQKPYPPLWIGGSAPAAVRRAARIADGFFGAGSTTTARFAEQVGILRAALAERGSKSGGADPAGFPVAKRVYIAVDDDSGRARERMAAALISVYGHAFGSGLLPVAVCGPPDACVQALREVANAGAGMILLTALFDKPAQMERLAAEVLPHLS
jgi:probable F420-dependent oxidoreductase